jgi:hypothetical protein
MFFSNKITLISKKFNFVFLVTPLLSIRYFLLFSIIFLSSCAHRPISFNNKQIFLGAFKSTDKVVDSCKLSEIEGLGFKVGLGVFGLGYFDRKTIEIINTQDGFCENDVFQVFSGKSAELQIELNQKTFVKDTYNE